MSRFTRYLVFYVWEKREFWAKSEISFDSIELPTAKKKTSLFARLLYSESQTDLLEWNVGFRSTNLEPETEVRRIEIPGLYSSKLTREIGSVVIFFSRCFFDRQNLRIHTVRTFEDTHVDSFGVLSLIADSCYFFSSPLTRSCGRGPSSSLGWTSGIEHPFVLWIGWPISNLHFLRW